MGNRALLIPVDPTERCRLVTINSFTDVNRFVGGGAEATRYDLDARMLVHGSGRIDGLPLNTRATDYIRRESLAGQRNPRLANDTTGYGLYGPVVVIGEDLGYDVPDRLVERFGAQRATST